MWKKAIFVGLFLVSIISNECKANKIDRYKVKRSIDLNDIYHYNEHQNKLPEKVIPSSYHLEIEPLFNENIFKGRVKINLTCMDTLDRISVNAHPDLQISNDIKVRELGSEETDKDPMELNVAKTELPTWKKFIFVIHLEQILKIGDRIELEINYVGNLTTNKTSGLFKNEYLDSKGQMHQFVATYLRMNHAQEVFPCLVDPQYKATFKLSIKHPKNMIARSNTPIESCTEIPNEPNMIWNHFAETPEMSTYQLAMVVSDFDSIVPSLQINGTKLEIRIWARKDYIGTLKNVPDKVVRIINYLQVYFNRSIGLPKLDIMAIPMFNAVKASDSWGLMFFKESELRSSLIWNTAYELIYQWIGQYITPYTWNHAPVNKMLNSFLASMTTVDINPDEMEGKWPMTILYSLYYEYGKTVPFSRVAGIRSEATAAKAELVFRMFNYTLGKDVFREGVRHFIQQQRDEKVPRVFLTVDIYSRLDEVAVGKTNLPQGLSILSISSHWISCERLPLVTVIRDYESGDIILNQKVYMREPPPPANNKPPIQWDIPIILVSETELDQTANFYQTKPYVWLTKSNEPKNLTIRDVTHKDHFIIINPEEIGMFPVNYDSCNWKMLSQFLQGPKRELIPVLTRAKLLHDSWNLAYAGELCFGIALNMTLFLKEERSHVVWEPVFTMIDHIGKRIEGSDVYTKFEAYIRSLLKPLYDELGDKTQPNDPSWKVHIRGLAKNFLCRTGYEPCVKEARDQFSKWLMESEPDKGNPVANEFICPVFKWGTNEEWEFGLQRVINFPRYSHERKQNERTYLLKTLAGCPKDTYKIQRLLNVTILDQNDNFSDSDIHLIFNMLTGGVAGYTTLFDFLVEHWDTIKQRFENKNHLWDGIINSATSSFKTQEGYDMVSELYQNRLGQFESANNIIQEALENIKLETNWREENFPIIEAWLDENLPKDQSQDNKGENILVTTTTTTTTTTTIITPIAG